MDWIRVDFFPHLEILITIHCYKHREQSKRYQVNHDSCWWLLKHQMAFAICFYQVHDLCETFNSCFSVSRCDGWVFCSRSYHWFDLLATLHSGLLSLTGIDWSDTERLQFYSVHHSWSGERSSDDGCHKLSLHSTRDRSLFERFVFCLKCIWSGDTYHSLQQ